MFCSEKVEAERFDLIRKTSPHIPNFSFKTNFCQRQHVPHNILLVTSWHFPTEAAQPGPPGGWAERGEPPCPSPGGGPAGLWLPAPDAGAEREAARAVEPALPGGCTSAARRAPPPRQGRNTPAATRCPPCPHRRWLCEVGCAGASPGAGAGRL